MPNNLPAATGLHLPSSAASMRRLAVDPDALTIEDFDWLRDPAVWADDPFTSYSYFLIDDGGSVSMTENFKFDKEYLGIFSDTLISQRCKKEDKKNYEPHLRVARRSWMAGLHEPCEKFVEIPVSKDRRYRGTELFWYVRCYGLVSQHQIETGKADVNGISYFSMSLDEIERKRENILTEGFMKGSDPKDYRIASIEIFIEFDKNVHPTMAAYTVRHKARDFVITNDPLRPAFYRHYPSCFQNPVTVATKFKTEG